MLHLDWLATLGLVCDFCQLALDKTYYLLLVLKEHALREHFQNALKASGLYGQGFTLHSLRHTFITRCAENKVSSAVAQKWAGHSSADMTQNVYTHVNEDFEKEEIAKFNKGVNDTYNQEKKTIRE